jgi:hypothetical protein
MPAKMAGFRRDHLRTNGPAAIRHGKEDFFASVMAGFIPAISVFFTACNQIAADQI